MQKRTASSIVAAINKDKAQGQGQYLSPANLEIGQSATVRFLPDANEDNLKYWAERRVTPLIFPGAIGGEQETDEPVVVRVPCLQTWGISDPVQDYFKSYWKGNEESRDYARSFYRTQEFIYACFAVQWPAIEQAPPENPIRPTRFMKSLHQRQEQGLMNAEFEMSPTDYDEGRDFKIVKVKKGDWANYEQSAYSYRSRSLNEGERAAIDKYGLIDLTALLGEVPTTETRKLILEAFEDSLAGRVFDQTKYPDFKAWPSYKAPAARPGATVQVPARTPGSLPPVEGQTSAVLAELRSRVTAHHSKEDTATVVETNAAA